MKGERLFTSYWLREKSIFDRVRTARRNATRGYALRNDVSRKFTFDDGDQWPLAIGSGKFRHALHAPWPCVCFRQREIYASIETRASSGRTMALR